jgi:hypothetical protein
MEEVGERRRGEEREEKGDMVGGDVAYMTLGG